MNPTAHRRGGAEFPFQDAVRREGEKMNETGVPVLKTVLDLFERGCGDEAIVGQVIAGNNDEIESATSLKLIRDGMSVGSKVRVEVGLPG